MPFRPSPLVRLLFIFAIAIPASGITLEDLRSKSDLTPAEFASFFRGFQFTFRKQVQSPRAFLSSKSGDCDDYSTLAAAVLREKGYTPRLVAVRMPGVVHVVCYIEEVKGYLDYNNRSGRNQLVSCENSLGAMADSVARSYNLPWSSASEFTFKAGEKRLVQTILEVEKEPKTFAGLFR